MFCPIRKGDCFAVTGNSDGGPCVACSLGGGEGGGGRVSGSKIGQDIETKQRIILTCKSLTQS